MHTNRKNIWEDQPRKPRIDVAAPLLLLAQNVFLEKTEEYLLNEQFDHSFIQFIHNLINTYEKNLGNNI